MEFPCQRRSGVAWTTSEEVEEASMHDFVRFGRRIGWIYEVEMSVQTGGGGEGVRSARSDDEGDDLISLAVKMMPWLRSILLLETLTSPEEHR